MPYAAFEMELMLTTARAHLDRRDLIGYVCARNVRVLEGELTEYAQIKNALLSEYGEANEDGVPYVTPDMDGYAEFTERFAPIANVMHEPPVMKLRYTDVVGELTGEEILAIDWMLED